MTLAAETDHTIESVSALATHTHSHKNIGACIASGSFKIDGMIIAPCSMRSLGEIASGTTSNLLTRSADVMLKERKRLVMMVRETPLTSIHLQNMLTVTQAGAIIAPPVPAFYSKPGSLQQMVEHTTGRILDLFGLDAGTVSRWNGMPTARQ